MKPHVRRRFFQCTLISSQPTTPAILGGKDSVLEQLVRLAREVIGSLQKGFRIAEIFDLNGWFLIDKDSAQPGKRIRPQLTACPRFLSLHARSGGFPILPKPGVLRHR